MKVKRTGIVVLLCAILLSFGCSVQCAKVINGNLLSVGTQDLRIATDNATITLRPAVGSQLLRGQAGKELRSASLRDFAPGDRIIAIINQNGIVVSVKAFYGIVKGIVSKATADSLGFKDGRNVRLSTNAQVTLPDGNVGKSGDIKPGSQVICRVNPVTGIAWMVISGIPEKTPKAALAKAKPELPIAAKKLQTVSQPASTLTRPEIKSISYSMATTSSGLVTVNLIGTPKAEASFEIIGLIPLTQMVEEAPGVYKASVKVPAGKSAYNAPVVGRLTVGAMKAIPIQASKLFSISEPSKQVAAKPQVILAVSKPEVKIETKVEPKTETSVDIPAKVAITLTNPPNGAKIRQAILVRGKASPDSTVMLTITYANGMTGILKLSGQLASESIALGKDGEFRMGPIALEGAMATPGLMFTIKAYYPDRSDHTATLVTVVGDRS